MAPGTDMDQWRHVLPPLTHTDNPEHTTIPVYVPHGSSVVVVVDLAGHEQFLTQVEDNTPPQDVDGVLTGRASFALPALDPGEYAIRATLEDNREVEGKVLVKPADQPPGPRQPEDSPAEPQSPVSSDDRRSPTDDGQGSPIDDGQGSPSDDVQTDDGQSSAPGNDGEVVEERISLLDVGRDEYQGRNWGLETAVYAMRSASSWGIGDLADLADLAAVGARSGADYLLLTPFITPASEAVQALGFSIGDDRPDGMVIDPIYIRPEDIREVGYLPTSQRTMLDWGSETIRQTNTDPSAIDFDTVWEAKRGALDAIHAAPRSPMRQAELERFVRFRGRAIADYVHAQVASETEDPQGTFVLLSEDSTAGAAVRRDRDERINFYVWLQWVGYQQLGHASYTADNVGMRLGLIFSTSARASEEFLTELMSHAGGLFLHDVADAGSDASLPLAQMRALADDAQVILFGDSAQPAPGSESSDSGVLASTTVWEEYDGATPRAAEEFPREAMVGVTTLGGPPTAGFLAEEYLELLNRLDLLDRPFEEVRKDQRIRRERLLDILRTRSLIRDDATERQRVEGLYRYLAHTPSHMVTVTIADAVGDRRPLVVGGEYPDWKLPITDGAGACVLIDELATNARFASLVEGVDQELRNT